MEEGRLETERLDAMEKEERQRYMNDYNKEFDKKLQHDLEERKSVQAEYEATKKKYDLVFNTDLSEYLFFNTGTNDEFIDI